jgi:hypothetical protein
MRKLLIDAFRICLPPVLFGNKYQEARNYTRTEEINRIQLCIVSDETAW